MRARRSVAPGPLAGRPRLLPRQRLRAKVLRLDAPARVQGNAQRREKESVLSGERGRPHVLYEVEEASRKRGSRDEGAVGEGDKRFRPLRGRGPIRNALRVELLGRRL